MENIRQISKLALLLVVVSCMAFSLVAAEDKTPPEVEKTDPIHGLIGAPTELFIQVWIVDHGEEYDFGPSGVDPTTVRLFVSGVDEPVHVQDIGSNRVRVYTQNMQSFPERHWVDIEVYAKDRSGNVMEPYQFSFCTKDFPDFDPPAIDRLSPEDKSTGIVCHPVISCRLSDYSGIELNSVEFIVDGEIVNFTSSGSKKSLQIFHVPDSPFDYGEFITVQIRSSDIFGNSSRKAWSFHTCAPPPDPPKQNFPTVGSLINYQKENGELRFVWSTDSDFNCFRVKLRAKDSPTCMVIDLGPEDYWNSGFLCGFSYYIGYETWKQYSTYDYMEWAIALIDNVGGNCVSDYSSWSYCILAPPDAVVIRTPEDKAIYSAFDLPPTFTWDHFNGAVSYLLGIARFNPQKNIYENKLTMYVESEITSVVLSEETWRSLGSGNYIWAVLAETESGHYSDFMNYDFRKNAPIIIDTPLTFN